jgi:hypothetical protein
LALTPTFSIKGLPNDPKSPVSYELGMAFVRNLKAIVDTSNRLLAVASGDPSPGVKAVKEYAANVAEISNWIFVTKSLLSPEEAALAAKP